TVARVLEQIHRAALTIPVIVMTYLNPVLAFGLERFVRDAAAAGVSGLVLTDFPAGADPEIEALVGASPLVWIRLIAPTTGPVRRSAWYASSPRRCARHDRQPPRRGLQPRPRDRRAAAPGRDPDRRSALDGPAARDRRHDRRRLPAARRTGAVEQVLLPHA